MRARVLSIKAVKKSSPRYYPMTGTPVSESPLNAYPLVRLVDPSLAVSKAKFDAMFVEYEEKFFGGQCVQKVKGYKNLDRLQDLLATFSIRRTTAEGMPEKVWQERTVTLGPEQRKLYNEVAKSSRPGAPAGGAGEEQLGLATLRHCQILNDPMILGHDVPSAKFDELELIAEEILQDPMAKMIVWTTFIDPIPRLLKRFAQYRPIAVYGATTDDELARYAATFDHSDNRLVFITPQKGGTGLDWLSRARYAVYIDEPWSLIQWLQSQDRLKRRVDIHSMDPIERIKGSPAILIRLRVEKSVDDLKRSYLERKAQLFSASTAISVDDLKVSQEELTRLTSELK